MYVEGLPVFDLPLLILINAGLQPGDPWYNAQVGPSRRRPHGCGLTYLQREGPNAIAHEIGHYDVAAKFWTDSTTARAMESAVGFNRDTSAIVGRFHALTDELKALQAVWDSNSYGIQDCDPYPLPR
jgi:hypothetical protein